MGNDKVEGQKGVLRRPKVSRDDGSTADWMSADAELLQKTIPKAAFRHCALRFGYTRNNGAYAIGVYAGVQYFTDYVRPSESIDDYLTDLCASLDDYEGTNELPAKKDRPRK